MRWIITGALAIAALGLILHAAAFDFVSDDAYISFVYARNLAEHGQLVFNIDPITGVGDRVEGYTNFLWTVLLAGLMKLGIPPELASRVLGAAFAIGTLILAARLIRCVRGQGRPTAWEALAPCLLAASSGFACWASGGLETQLFTFLVVLGLERVAHGRWPAAGAAFALSAMTRPEGSLVLAVVALHHYVSTAIVDKRFRPNRCELLGAAWFLGLYVPYFAWRWWYYGWPFPNTFYVKAGGQPDPAYAKKMLENGLFYAWQWATQSKAIYAAPLALFALIKHPRAASLAVLLTAVYLGYTIKVGGDFMGLHRFVMPLFVLVAITATLGLAALTDLIPRVRPRQLAAVILAAALVGAFGASQRALTRISLEAKADHGIDRPGYLAAYAHDRGLIGLALAPHILPTDFAIVGGAGIQPYYGHLRAIDVFGLVSEEIAHTVRPSNPRPGHQKWAPASLILKYDPTFVFSCYGLHREPKPRSIPWRCGDAGVFMARGYEPVTIHVPGMVEAGEYYTFLKKKDRAWP